MRPRNPGRQARSAVAALLLVTAVGVGPGARSANPPPASPRREHGGRARGPFAVGIRVETFLDSSRPTGASGDVAAHPGRILRTLILYPARAPGGPGATPVAGPFPLVVFSHGWGMHGLLYGDLLRPWAAAGFVVAAPTFPLTSIGAPGGGVMGDYVNQPADVSFVVTQMLRRDRGDGLGGLVDRHRIAAVGHSLGAVTTLALASNRCCRDTRIRAAVAIAGEDLRFPGGSIERATRTPVMLIHGDHDLTVAYTGGVRAYTRRAPPKFLLTVVGGDHWPTADRARDPVDRAALDFLDHYLRGRGKLVARLRGDVRGQPIRLRVATV